MSVYVGEFLIGTNGPVEYHLAASFADSTKSGWKIGRSTHFDAALSADFLKIIRPRRHQRNTALFLNLQRPLYLCPHGARATSVSWRKHHPSGGLVLTSIKEALEEAVQSPLIRHQFSCKNLRSRPQMQLFSREE